MATPRAKTKPDPYEILGVKRSATGDEIKSAYRRKAKKAHPDHGGSSAAFTELHGASLILLDPVRKERFDKTGETEEPKAAEDPDAKPIAIINGLFKKILLGEEDPSSADLVQSMVDHFGKEIAEIRNQARPATTALKRAQKLKKKFTKRRSKSGRDAGLIERMMERFEREAKEAIDTCDRGIKDRERAIEILKDYDFESDPRPPPTVQMWTFATN